MKRPVYVLCNGQDAFCGHASTALGAKRVASKYGYQTKGGVSVSAQGRFVVMGNSFEGKV
jgi:hypothetical protein